MSPTRTIDGPLGLRASRRATRRERTRATARPSRRLARRRALALLLAAAVATAVTVLGREHVLSGTGAALVAGVAYLLLALAVVAELRVVQREQARAAASEERKRIARELHDGVAQEVLHLLAQARRLRQQRPGPEADRLLDAAERALDESRSAISALRAPSGESLSDALARVAGELGRRLHLDVRLDVDPAVEAAPPVCDAVTRIVGETLANAARHGGAHGAAIELHAGTPCRLLIRDDGRGFDPDPARLPAGAFGLLSMQERAAAVGGRLAIRSARGAGTEIEVTLP